MSSAMVKVYANLVKRGMKKLEDVPEKLRAEVEAELNPVKEEEVVEE